MGMIIGTDDVYCGMGFECLDEVLSSDEVSSRNNVKYTGVYQNDSRIEFRMLWKPIHGTNGIRIERSNCQFLFQNMFKDNEDDFLSYVRRLGYNPNYRWKHYVLIE